MLKEEANLGSAGRAGLRDRMEVEGPAGVGFTLKGKRFICFASDNCRTCQV